MSDILPASFAMRDGVRIAAEIDGDASRPLVVLLHGGGQTRHSWSRAMRTLVASGYRVISYDARGHGDSSWSPTGAYSLEAHARDLGEIMARQRGPFALVGASLGGATAIFAHGLGVIADPAAMVFVDIVPTPDPEGVARIRAFMAANANGFADVGEAADAVAAYNTHRPRPRDTSGLMKNLRPRDGRLFWHWDPRLLDDEEWRVRTDQMIAFARGIKIPALLVRGSASDVVNEAGITAFREMMPHLEIAEVSGAGHMVAGDRNDAFNTAIFRFLGRNLAAGVPQP